MVTYHEKQTVELPELIDLYNSVGWTAYTDYPEKMEKLLPHSLWHLVARDDDTLVGLIRVVGDDASIVYIQDILVHPDYQRQGIGRELIQQVMERFRHIRQTVLITDDEPKTKAFYLSVGLKAIEDVGGACFVRYQQGV